MARYTSIHTGLKLLPVDVDQQVIPGRFEHALCHVVDHVLDLTEFHARHKHDDEGAPAFDPAALINIILLADSRGISRNMERACRENVLFIAVPGDSHPHFTTLAAVVSEMGEGVASLFAQVLLVCDRQGLIGRELVAIEGVTLPRNARTQKSGTRADDQRQLDKMEAATQKMIAQQKHAATAPPDEARVKREALRLERLHKEACQRRDWLKTHPEDRTGAKGAVRLSNRTDNGSAKMATSTGVIQGSTGVAAVDAKAQIIVEAQAHGTGSEQALWLPLVMATAALRTPTTVITADAGDHSEANLKALADTSVEASIPDNGYRTRDERDADQAIHTAKPDPLWNKAKTPGTVPRFTPQDFRLAEDRTHGTCPAGKRLYGNGSNCTGNGVAAIKFRGAEKDCLPCARRHEWLRTPEKTKTRQVAFFQGKRLGHTSFTDRMKMRIDSERGRRMITRRFATVEPVCGTLHGNTHLCRFSLRGQQKVDGQWKLYGLMHNIEKLAHHGY